MPKPVPGYGSINQEATDTAPSNRVSPESVSSTMSETSSAKFPAIIFPIFMVFIGLITLLTCVIVNRAYGHDIGGNGYPYFSDTGKEVPEYYVFSFGLSLTAFTMFIVLYLNLGLTADMSKGSACRQIWNWINFISGVIATPCMSLLAIVDTDREPGVHLFFALSFFLFICIFAVSHTILFALNIFRNGPEEAPVPRSVLYASIAWKIICVLLIAFFFIMLYPVLLTTTVAMGCSEDYSKCKGVQTTRAIFQHLTILSIILYMCSFCLEFWYVRLGVVTQVKRS